MAPIKKKFPYLTDGNIDLATWLQKITEQHQIKNINYIDKACHLAATTSKGLTTFYGQPCIEQGLEMAEIILDLKLDPEAVAAAILISAVQHTNLNIDTITLEVSQNTAQLVAGVTQMNVINNLANLKTRDQTQIDRLRKTLLAMASDIRVVLIKIAERTSIMRGIKNINPIERKRLAQETMDLYAPLANRLGIGQLKWELEDIAFHYTDPETYKTIATFLAEKRIDREHRITETITRIKEELKKANIHADLSGRAKHIYSIYIKAQRKHLDYREIYDTSAVRILVPTIEACYNALSIVHHIWEHIPDEFDDYIVNPKPNGYRSIHTAVKIHDGKNMEIQIRTHEMHEFAEHGIAAHWIYKENKPSPSGYESKITFLRQLLAWHKDVAKEGQIPDKVEQQIFEDRVYVFTPAGAILDLPVGATPIDFAYHIHSNVGDSCRGAKINGHIVPLTYALQTGDQVEIITQKNGTPSRDWLNKELGYVKTPRARAKIAQWFRQQDITQYLEAGKHTFEREIARAGIHNPNIQKIAVYCHYKDDDALFLAIGHGMIRMAHVIQAANAIQHHPVEEVHHTTVQAKKTSSPISGLRIAGADTFLTRIARCCKPIPSDEIIGYITQGRGVSIHRKNCSNIAHIDPRQGGRFLDVSWDNKQLGSYYVDLQIRAYGREDLVKEITAAITNLKINLISLNSTSGKSTNMLYITITIQINEITQLNQLVSQLNQLPNIIDVKRIREK